MTEEANENPLMVIHFFIMVPRINEDSFDWRCCEHMSFHWLGDSKWLCVHVRYLLCYCSKFLYYTGLRETWSDCVFMFGMCCVIAVSLFLYYTELRETWSDCVFMFIVLCYSSKSISLLSGRWQPVSNLQGTKVWPVHYSNPINKVFFIHYTRNCLSCSKNQSSVFRWETSCLFGFYVQENSRLLIVNDCFCTTAMGKAVLSWLVLGIVMEYYSSY